MILKNVKPKPTRYLSGIVNSNGFYIDWKQSKNKKLIVVWRGALKQNVRDRAQPKVAVLLQELTDDMSGLTAKRYCLFFNANLLGIVRIGTIWEIDSHGKAELLLASNYNKRTFKVDCQPGNYEILSLKDIECLSSSRNASFPILGQWDGYFANSKVIKFTTTKGFTVLVPCLEWFTRTYGVSASMRRVLLTDSLRYAKRKIFAVPSEPYFLPKEDWYVCANKALTIGDACFLAHLQHSDSVRARVDDIFNHIITADNPERMFIPIQPWNDNVCMISVRGMMLNDNKTFLALNVNGFENPICPKIHLDKGFTYKELDDNQDPKPPTPQGEEDEEEVRHEFDDDDPEIEQDGNPGGSSNTRRVYDDEMEFFNQPEIQKVWTANETAPDSESDEHSGGYPTVGPSDDEPLDTGSIGDPEGSNNELDNINLTTPSVVKDKGILRVMWMSFMLFKKRYPKMLRSVEYFTFSEGFVASASDGDLKMVKFPNADVNARDEIKKWLKKPVPDRNRGCFVIRLLGAKGFIYVLEIERTRHQTKQCDLVESNFKGLVFTLEDDSVFEKALNSILASTLEAGGFFSKSITFEGQRKVGVFIHRRAQNKNNIAKSYFSVVWNIFKKMNIDSR